MKDKKIEEVKEELGRHTMGSGNYNPLCDMALRCIKQLEGEKEQIRKETAKEILSAIKDIEDDGAPFKNYYWFERLCKQYGVEVDE